MIVIHVSVTAKAEVIKSFQISLQEVVTEARSVAGCTKYEWYHVPNSTQSFVIFGEFDTKENFEKYLNSTVVKRIGEELIPLLTAPPIFKHYEATVLEGN